MLNHRNIFGSTCQTSTGWRSSPQPSVICRVDGHFSDHTALFSSFCLNLQTVWPQFSDLWGNVFSSTCGPLQVDGHLVTGIHKPVDLYRLTAIFGPAVKILPNLSQPVDLYRLTSTFRIYQKVSKTVETLTGWRTVGFKFLLFFSTCRPMQVDGQFSTIERIQSFWR